MRLGVRLYLGLILRQTLDMGSYLMAHPANRPRIHRLLKKKKVIQESEESVGTVFRATARWVKLLLSEIVDIEVRV